LYEIEGVAEDVAMEALRRAGHKLPLEWRVVKREGVI
jgi:large subunit ribosomal protein L16